MSRFIVAILLFTGFFVKSQEHLCSKAKIQSTKKLILSQYHERSLSPAINHELEYDVKFVHLNLELERTNKFVKGGVTTVATVTASVMDTFMCVLHQNHSIDSIRFNGVLMSHTAQDSAIKIKPTAPIPNGQSFTVTIYYKGTAPIGGAAIGNGYSNGTSGAWGNQVSWSLSEAHAAYHWWPCKQILTDKIDSSWVFVTTDSTNKVGSNGLLENVTVIGNKKRYEWKNRHMINYYLISVAIAKYKEYTFYAKPLYIGNDSIMIQNYIYDNAINSPVFINGQKIQLDKTPQQLDFYSKLYGMYPFYKQKYGHCMAPFSGGMEHQTMTSLGFFDYYLDAHELAHQWWGDNVTCKSWSDIWINEGFASYSEHLIAQYLDPSNFHPNLASAHSNVMSQTGGSIHFSGNDTMNAARIFSGRLTYDKGGAIVHTLRFVTNNDSLWFNTLKGFQNQFKNSTASAMDFMNYFQTQTSINPTQFFNQWYYGEGYPTFDVKWNFVGNTFVLKSDQSTSKPSSVPLFITPMEYQLFRTGAADTTIRVQHNVNNEYYNIPMLGTVTNVFVDPNNWVINKTIGPAFDNSLLPNGIIEENGSSDVKISPNPSNDYFYIALNKADDYLLKVYDSSGRLIKEDAFQDQTFSLDLSPVSEGIYLLELYNKSGKLVYNSKLVKQKN